MTPSALPHWKTAVANALAKNNKSVVIQLASIDPITPVPHVRSHIFREFLAPASNPSLPLIVTTTDIRSPKTTQLISNPHVQVAWWFEATEEQFRVSGLASVIPSPSDSLYNHFIHAVNNANAESALAAVAAFHKEGFDWEAKRKAMFKSMSAHMKASWCRPVPGTKLKGGTDEADKWLQRLEEPGKDADEQDRKNWETALSNFALVIVDPIEVDYVELGVVPNRRTRYWKSNDGSWSSEALVP